MMRFCGCCGGNEEHKPGLFANNNSSSNANNNSSHHEDEQEDEQEQRQKSIEDREHQINLHSTFREKRNAINAEPIDLTVDFQAPYYPKSPSELQFLNQALEQNFIFSSLEDYERRKLMDAFQKQVVPADYVIIRQNEEDGDFFYVVQEGEVDFIANDVKVGSTGRGGSFGELALLYNSPRAATCLATTECILWKVDQHTFRHVLARQAQQEEEEICTVLSKIPLFDSFPRQYRLRLIDALTKVTFKEGERIVQKGDEGEVFYMIQSGTVKVHDIGLGDSQFVDQILTEGDWFGERALLTGEPRAANVTAMSKHVTTLCLSRKNFERVNGLLLNIIERGMKKNFLMGIPLFAGSKFTNVEMDHIADALTEMCFEQGSKIAEIGKPYTQSLWIIQSGHIMVRGMDGTTNSLLSGDYFGDKSIKAPEGHISSHDAIMEERTTCWVLSRKDLEDVIGDIDRLSDCYMPFTSTITPKSIGLSEVKKHQLLGMGAFGKVWLVSHKTDHVPYAMKELDKRALIKGKQYDAVLREKTIMQSMQHPFILSMVSSFQDDHHLYLLLELVQGGELFNVVHTDASDGLPNDRARFYSACVLEALGYMHLRNICYRDLKPENVLIDSKGYCIVVDMGFAKVVVDKTFTLCGTPEYLAPEIIMSKGHGKAVDWWSYGVLVYELLVGRSPFYLSGTSQSSLFKRIVIGKYTVPSFVDESAKDLMEQLLVCRQAARLGNLSRGHRDIKDHAWFQEIDFKKLVKKEIPAPWVPVIKDPLDASHFGDFGYAEQDHEIRKAPLTQKQQALFKDF